MSENNLIYIANVFLYYALFHFLNIASVNLIFFPLIFMIFSFIIYSVSEIISTTVAEQFRKTALTGAILIPLFSMVFAPGRYRFNNFLEHNALISAYFSTILFAFDAFRKKSENSGYIASLTGITTYLWQMKYIGMTNQLFYSQPLAIYYMALGYTRILKNDYLHSRILNIVGSILLIGNLFLLSFGKDAILYSLLLGAESIILIFLGTTLANKEYRYAGICALVLSIIPQTYDFILSLPRWLFVGLIGIIFLSLAISLLLKRKE